MMNYRLLRRNRLDIALLLCVFLCGVYFIYPKVTRETSVVDRADWERNVNELRELRHFKQQTARGSLGNSSPEVSGPGEYGRGFVVREDDLDAADKVKYRAGYKEHGFNEYASDLIALHRKLPKSLEDDRCKALQYPGDLPTVSVIIPFRDEAWSTLLRTVHGVLDRSPPRLLKEVILVDDNSSLPHLKQKLDVYVRELPIVTLVRLAKTSGLMMARQAGIEHAECDVIVVMDSHVEVAEGWLEPLLLPIYQNHKVMTFPRVDSINKDDFRYSGGNLNTTLQVPNFDFYLNMVFSRLTKEYEAQRHSLTDPVLSPTIQGWMFVMRRDFFWQLGGFDPEMDVWGAEQFEISFKVWMCGGRIEMPPCSHAGHVYRQVKWTNFWSTYLKNNYRVAETWMDEYATIHKERTAFSGNAGDVSKRKELRERLQCKSFAWYLDTIKQFVRMYVPENRKAKGTIRNGASELCIRGIHHGSAESTPELRRCRDGFEYDWDLSDRDELRHQYQCFDVKDGGKVITRPCDSHREKQSQKWVYTEENTLQHIPTKKCLSAPTNAKHGSLLELATCDVTSPRQQWDWNRLT